MNRSMMLAFVGAAVIGACGGSSNNPTSGPSGSGAGTGSSVTSGAGGTTGSGTNSTGVTGTGSTGTTGVTGSSTSGATTTGSSGAGGAPPAACSNTDKTIIPIDSTGWVPRNCTDYGIQGAFYCYSDGFGSTSCVTGKPPYEAASPGPGMCLSGTTASTTTTPSAYGAAIGFTLSETGGTNSVKDAYDATTYNIVGFDVTITGSTGGLPIRVGFTAAATSTDPAPFVSLPGPGTYTVLFSAANVPTTWMVPNAGATVNPASIYDISFQISADATAANYDWCVSSLKPHLSSTSSSSSSSSGGTGCGTLTPYGSADCASNSNYTFVSLNDYGLQNDFYNGSGSQCLQAMQSASCAGFTVTPSNVNAPTSGAPASYPSLVYGWHYGAFHGGYTSAKQVSAVKSVPTTWDFTTSSGTWDVSYDIWLHPSNPNPSTPSGGLELMIWADHSGATPFGSQVGTVTLAGTSWAVWKGTMSSWTYLAYVEPSGNANGSVSFDIMTFLNDAMTRNVGLSSSWYLLSVESGFELWNANAPMATTAYSVSID